MVNNKNKVIVMQCTSRYPCEAEKVGLNIIKKMKNKFNQKNQSIIIKNFKQIQAIKKMNMIKF
jgi:hypothetical protein